MSPLRLRPSRLALALTLVSSAPLSVSAQSSANAEIAVRALFQQRCADCHSPAGDDENPTLSTDTDLAKLRTDARYIAIGSPENSPLFQRVTLAANDKNRMPKSSKSDPRPPLTEAELAVLRAWVAPAATTTRPFVEERDIVRLVLADLQAAGANARFTRYLTLHNLANAGDTEDELETYRAALSKLVNSLSWEKRIVRPEPVDPARLVFRIDLRAYGWTADKWDRLVNGYPYALQLGIRPENEIANLAGTPVAVLRGDWFTFAASQPPLYEELLGLPATDLELERSLLQVDVAGNQRRGLAQRSGFIKSGVSASNRMIERHPTRYGAYWKSYDFKANENHQDLLRHPLGPVGLSKEFAFLHDGGEMIWNLPNGLQAYLLATDKGTRISRGPTEIVRDPARDDVAIINGISCMSCHAQGMRVAPKGNLVDELRPASDALDLAPDEVALLRMLYPDPKHFESLYTADAARFREALIAAGVFDPNSPDAAKRERSDPVGILYNRFTQPITLATAPSEFGLSRVNLQERLDESADSALRSFGKRLQAAGSFSRKGFLQQFRRTVLGLHLGELRKFQPIAHADFFPDGKVPNDFNDLQSGNNGGTAQPATPEASALPAPLADLDRARLLAAGAPQLQAFVAPGAFRGPAGVSGRGGVHGAAGIDGAPGESLVKGYGKRNGKPGTPGGNGIAGTPGGDAGDAPGLFIRVTEFRFATLPAIARITVTRLDGAAALETYWDLGAQLTFDARGGNGGPGGEGGSGGRGGSGGYGGEGLPGSQPTGGEGGKSGVGGNGANGSNGGNGGDGARVRIRVEGSPGFVALVQARLRVDVSGGLAGRAGAPGAAGAGGTGLEDPNPGNNPYTRGGRGSYAEPGKPGAPATSGQPGASGTVVFE